MEFLKARFGASALAPATPAPSAVRKHFAGTRAPSLRPLDVSPVSANSDQEQAASAPAKSKQPSAAKNTASAVSDSHPKSSEASDSPVVVTPTAASRTADSHAATPRQKIAHAADNPAPVSPTPAPRVAAAATPAGHHKGAHTAEAASTPAASPTPAANIASTSTAHRKGAHVAEAAATPAPSPTPQVAAATPPARHGKPAAVAAITTPAPRVAAIATPAPRVAAVRVPETPSPAKATPPARHPENLSLETRITDVHPMETRTTESEYARMRMTNPRGVTVAGHYPWKAGIVTTVFWIGEPVGGHNFTPNYASSWDSNWTRAYGGYDNPNPEARHNYIPVNFIPRQNPFYCALPYNDVTRGTTKPEARVVIPWFREAFRKEGQSVCRDRWVEIHSRSGRIVYAQWSDCGPFRTDHWQYVFGSEKPRPNLNQGAGLDVSPAVRDYLGLQPTDVTDWKFVDDREVPNGPWALYGDNNTCAQRGVRLVRASNW